MISNNATDSLVGGGFEVKAEGPIYDYNDQPTGRTGQFTCDTRKPPFPAPFAAPPHFESILGETDGDS